MVTSFKANIIYLYYRKMASGGQDDCIDREDYFMLAAVLASKRSKDPNTKVKNLFCSSKFLRNLPSL